MRFEVSTQWHIVSTRNLQRLLIDMSSINCPVRHGSTEVNKIQRKDKAEMNAKDSDFRWRLKASEQPIVLERNSKRNPSASEVIRHAGAI